MQEIGIETSILSEILAGNKTIEGRLGKPKFLKLRVGDKLSLREDVWEDGKIVKSIPDRAIVVIKQLLYFESFEELLNSIDYKKAIPSAVNIYEARAIYRQFYTVNDEDKYGVVAIEFSLL